VLCTLLSRAKNLNHSHKRNKFGVGERQGQTVMLTTLQDLAFLMVYEPRPAFGRKVRNGIVVYLDYLGPNLDECLHNMNEARCRVEEYVVLGSVVVGLLEGSQSHVGVENATRLERDSSR